MSGELKQKSRRKPGAISTEKAVSNYNAADLDRPTSERWITMSNALTRAAHGLSLSEKRIVAMAAATLDSRKVLKPSEAPTTRISAADYAETYGIDLDTAYNQLQAAAKALYNRSITFYVPAHRRNGKPLPPTQVQMRWVGEAHYHKGEGWIELFWWHKVLPYLTGLKKNFTSYQLQQTSALRSIYSWKLLELVTQYASTGWMEFTVEDFGASMGATEKQQSDFGKIRTKIIEPAVRELTEKDGWLIEWKPIKKGRKVAKLRFNFKRNPQPRLL
ncbi:replication initiation protein [Acetobacter pasteurianus]